jgi:N-acetylmuramoyl-L-alanine amidase
MPGKLDQVAFRRLRNLCCSDMIAMAFLNHRFTIVRPALPFFLAVFWLFPPQRVESAQPDLKSAILEKAKERRDGKKPALILVRPEASETWYPRISFAGATDPDAAVTVNGKKTKVHPTGAFAGMADLKPGKNSIAIVAANEHGSVKKAVEVYRRGGGEIPRIPRWPIAIDKDQPMAPSADHELREGDTVEVSFFGSAGHKASFRVGEKGEWRPMTERTEAGNGASAYESAYRLGGDTGLDGALVHFRLESKSKDKTGPPAFATAPGKLTDLSGQPPRVVETLLEYTPVYPDPKGRRAIAILPKGLTLASSGSQGSWRKVALGEGSAGWLRSKDSKLLKASAAQAVSQIGSLDTLSDATGTTITVEMDKVSPLIVSNSSAPPRLTARIPGARISAALEEPDLQMPPLGCLSWDSTGDESAKLIADLAIGRAWGWKVNYAQDCVQWFIKSPPDLGNATGELPLRGLSVIVDPGHGGVDTGAVGATGLAESDVNLAVAKLLAERLEGSGAEAMLTRSTDKYLKLDERVRMAERSGADLFVSIHNNSVDENKDPNAARGTMVLYYHDQALPLAQAIYARTSAATSGIAPQGVDVGDFSVLRNHTSMPSVLIEGLFVSSPEDEALLMSGKFLDGFADTIYKGIVDCLDNDRSG